MQSEIKLTILGSTGTIGENTLDVVSRHASCQVIALTANTQVEKLYQQCLQFQPRYVAVADEAAASLLAEKLQHTAPEIIVLSGVAGLETVAALDEVNTVMAAIVGAAGLLPTLAAARAGKKILLANKEALVMSGHLFMEEVRHNKATLLPIDSEHNAIFQCMPEHYADGLQQVGVNKILLTASGGPFRTKALSELKNVTPAQAVAHPNWVMGQKISVDSATMMNKGLEVIEACWLFNTTVDMIEVVIHPQSIIHSMVSYKDGSVLAQLGNPDMRTPIAHAMAWPERIESGVEPLDFFEVANFEFEKPDMQRFACLRLAYEAMKSGGTATTILNAANEVAVDAFLKERIGFLDIPQIIESSLNHLNIEPATSLDQVLKADQQARLHAEEEVLRNHRTN
ncbi:MAG: 1-deoxy-D-xylulose-5-phosphate reductoisomerase [Gammaproteobacteria bacterium]|nr:1-deoxy-D-xylulose-5-phosphate reductoisomerase [Gammaproteobacteria bacterium]